MQKDNDKKRKAGVKLGRDEMERLTDQAPRCSGDRPKGRRLGRKNEKLFRDKAPLFSWKS